MIKLKTIEIQAVRGVRNWEIPLEGKSLVLWGENASGKSSVVDALEFFFTGSIKHLEGTMGISVARHAPHIDLGRDKMVVSASFDPGSIKLSRSASSEPTVPPVLQPLWADACSGSFILRRSQLLEFIHADPADRFRAIASMIGADPLDDVELAIMRARDHFEGERESHELEGTRIHQRMKEIMGDRQPIEVINEEAAALQLSRISDLESLSSSTGRWLRSAKLSDQERIAALQRLKRAIDALITPPLTENELLKFTEAHSTLRAERTNIERLSEAELLQQGEHLIERSRTPICPLCEQPIDLESTLTSIRKRRRMLQELSTSVSDLRKQQQSLLTSINTLQSRIQELAPEIGSTSTKTSEALNRLIAEFPQVSAKSLNVIRTATEFKAACDVGSLADSLRSLRTLCPKVAQDADRELNNLALTPRDKAILALVEKGQRIAALSRDMKDQQKRLNDADRLAQRARYIYETFSGCKKARIRSIYSTIQDDVGRFYGVLHPGEPHKDFQIALSLGRRASTNLRIKAFGREASDPRAFTSEAHLDSLGLCIFLAFLKNFRSGCPLIVLDDVVMSVDTGHRGRVAELLLTEFANWQLVITTHDEIWLEELHRHQRAFGAEGRFLNLRIQRWSLQEGPIVSPYQPRWERIESRLDDADKTGAANDARQFLEWILFEICISTEASVPIRRDGRYTVADLEAPARMRLTKLFPSMTSRIDNLFGEITVAATPGNLLSHYNADAQSLSLPEIRRFCEAAKSLADWYLCESCGRVPVYYRQPRELRCPNSRCESPKNWHTR